MNREELNRISEAIKDIPDDVKAWEQTCDFLYELTMKQKQRIMMDCQTSSEYVRNIYPVAHKLAQVIHVMATVPVHLLVRTVSEKEQVLITLYDNEDPTPYLPIFFSKSQAEAEVKYIDREKGEIVDVIRVPFLMLIDNHFGFFSDTPNVPLLTLFETRKDKPAIFLTKFDVMAMLVDSTRTLRSQVCFDFGPQIVPNTKPNAGQETQMPNQPMPPFGGRKKPPVS